MVRSVLRPEELPRLLHENAQDSRVDRLDKDHKAADLLDPLRHLVVTSQMTMAHLDEVEIRLQEVITKAAVLGEAEHRGDDPEGQVEEIRQVTEILEVNHLETNGLKGGSLRIRRTLTPASRSPPSRAA